jgi:Uma2 family endonuclease
LATIVIDEQIRIPTWVADLDSFRRWAHSRDFPERGRFAYLGGELWVDLSMERLIHNLIKTAVNCVLASLAKGEVSRVLAALAKMERLGLYLGDGMLLTNPDAELSTAPDGMFISTASLEKKRAQLRKGLDSLEVLGSPDMVLEVISPTSVKKDKVLLRRLYWDAGILEYWLIDSRLAEPRLDILRRDRSKYTQVRAHAGWVKSKVFGKEFQLAQHEASPGVPDFTLEVR